MIILEAQKDDLQEILALQYLAYQSEAALLGTNDIQPLQQIMAEIEQEFAEGKFLKAVAADGGIIGSVRARVDNGTLYIGKLLVHPKFRRQGIGTRLLQEIEERYPHYRYELFTSSKSLHNIRLYERAGYCKFAEKQLTEIFSFVFMEKNNWDKVLSGECIEIISRKSSESNSVEK